MFCSVEQGRVEHGSRLWLLARQKPFSSRLTQGSREDSDQQAMPVRSCQAPVILLSQGDSVQR